jgi:hypothetical protein
MDQQKIHDLLREAITSEYGIVVETNNLDWLRRQLYTAMRPTKLTEEIALLASPDNPQKELWLVKRKTGRQIA